MHIPEKLSVAAAALRRDLEPHFAPDTCAAGPEVWQPGRPVVGHNWPVAMVASVELPRRTGMATRLVAADKPEGPHSMLRVNSPEGEYDVDLTADCWGDIPVWISSADPSRHREESTPFVSADAYNMGHVLAARAGITLE